MIISHARLRPRDPTVTRRMVRLAQHLRMLGALRCHFRSRLLLVDHGEESLDLPILFRGGTSLAYLLRSADINGRELLRAVHRRDILQPILPRRRIISLRNLLTRVKFLFERRVTFLESHVARTTQLLL